MISQKVDLTAHRDFSTQRPSILNFHLRQSTGGGGVEFDDLFMSKDDYEVFTWRERFFGRRRHFNEKARIFNYEAKYEQLWKGMCVRCGRPLMNWDKSYGNVCRQCDCILEGNRVPWKKYYIPFGTDSTDDLFNLR